MPCGAVGYGPRLCSVLVKLGGHVCKVTDHIGLLILNQTIVVIGCRNGGIISISAAFSLSSFFTISSAYSLLSVSSQFCRNFRTDISLSVNCIWTSTSFNMFSILSSALTSSRSSAGHQHVITVTVIVLFTLSELGLRADSRRWTEPGPQSLRTPALTTGMLALRHWALPSSDLPSLSEI